MPICTLHNAVNAKVLINHLNLQTDKLSLMQAWIIAHKKASLKTQAVIIATFQKSQFWAIIKAVTSIHILNNKSLTKISKKEMFQNHYLTAINSND